MSFEPSPRGPAKENRLRMIPPLIVNVISSDGCGKLAKIEMWPGHPLWRYTGRCRVPRRMEPGVESISHLRGAG